MTLKADHFAQPRFANWEIRKELLPRAGSDLEETLKTIE